MPTLIEYDYPHGVYRPRVGSVFTTFNGVATFDTLAEADAVLSSAGLRIGRKTDSRTWEIVPERKQ